jgi:aldose 1-epimerase
MSIQKIIWGKTGNSDICLYTIEKGALKLKVCNYGCTVIGLTFHGKEVILGYNNAEALLNDKFYMGCLVGRFAGRISGAGFEIDGTLYHLPANDGNTGNHLHGGPEGFNKICFKESAVDSTESSDSISFTAMSTHLDQGYPGNLLITCTITVNEDNEIIFDYDAVPDQATHINLTHHLYYNLGDSKTALDQELQINAGMLVETGKHYIPSGMFVNLTNDTDFRSAKKIPVTVDYNDCYVLNRSDPGGVAALLSDNSSAVQMQLSTSCPSILFYSGQFLDHPFAPKQGICLETQFFPDSPNNKNFPSTLYEEGERFHEYTKLAFKKITL